MTLTMNYPRMKIMTIWTLRLNLRLFFPVQFQYSLGRGVIMPPPKIFLKYQKMIKGRNWKQLKPEDSSTRIVLMIGLEQLQRVDLREDPETTDQMTIGLE